MVTFPEGFLWGTATSSYQIEGATDVDGKGESIWDRFCAVPGAIADGSDGRTACDHYHRYRDDVALMARLGMQAYRFSVAWTRILPDGRTVNPAGLDFYDRLADELLAADIRPLATLYHWDLPQALQDAGGWVQRDTAEHFAVYTETLLERLGDRVDTWMTINEPFVVSDHGHVTGEHAPGHRSVRDGLAVSHHVLLAHARGLERIRAMAPDATAGIVLNFTPAVAETDSAADRFATARRDDIENRWYADPLSGRGYPAETVEWLGWDQAEVRDGDLEAIARPIDLLGVNFYTRQVVSADPDREVPKVLPTTAMDWEIDPPTFGKLLRWLHDHYDFPRLMVMENGAAMPDDVRIGGTPDGQIDDQDRIDYLRGHLAEVASAIADGVPVVGYQAWSFLDNFEWAWGYGGRFGIVEVDFDTLERRPKASAEWYSRVIADNGFDEPVASGGHAPASITEGAPR